MANTYLTRTVSSTGNRTKATLSVWVKKSSNAEQFLFYNHESNTTNFRIRFNPEVLQVETLSGSSVVGTLTTNRKFRDPSGFYHIVVAIDSTSGTADDRMKIYVNGVQETSFSARTNPPQNQNMAFNESSHVQYIGSQVTANYFNGIMSHYYWIDGTAYPASTFGSTDSTTGEWKINTSPSVTMGTNGFTILKDGNTITDQSSNSNNFALGGGTLTKTEDCPSNVFATLNPLAPSSSGLDIRNGNTHVFNDDDNTAWQTVPATLAIPSTAKIYWEIKCVNVWGSGSCEMHGIADLDNILQGLTGQASDNTTSFAWRNDASFRTNGGTISSTTWATSYTTGDILMFALDNANGALYAGKNGTWLNSGNPTSGASKTGALSVTAGLNYAPHSELKYGSDKPAYNFGNGHYVTTAISSAGTSASTPGIFEYDVPTGYQPLSTKGLNA